MKGEEMKKQEMMMGDGEEKEDERDKESMLKKGFERKGCRDGTRRGQKGRGRQEGCPPLFLTSKGFITLLCDNSSWRSSVKSRQLRYPSASRITMPFTAVSLYQESNLPLQITPRSQEHNSSPTMQDTTDKETVHADKLTHKQEPTHE
ncbi:Hemin import ATP-binding protein HmuV [Dissostichus eleginoides]|uniref:Hemin import ATP-binding protein HmuV n=1 Tax=Dissostichus eleginoides TaxID=100907 RepID=A0AAD9C1T4_DISEL|nr:Hemin import ATP-binding protein HmuV [Dissostichus eleginoides]